MRVTATLLAAAALAVAFTGDALAQEKPDASELARLPWNPFATVEAGAWESLTWTGSQVSMTWRATESDAKDAHVSLATNGQTWGLVAFSRERAPTIASYVGTLLALAESPRSVTRAPTKRTIAGKEIACDELSFHAKLVTGNEADLKLAISREVPLGFVALEGESFAITLAAFGKDGETKLGAIPKTRSASDPFADRPGIFHLRGVYEVSSQGGEAAPAILIPLPLVHGAQVPLSWSVTAEPRAALKAWRVSERAPGDWVATVELASLEAGASVHLEWVSEVLCGPSDLTPIAKSVTLTQKSELPEDVRPWLRSTRYAPSDDARFQAIAKDLLQGSPGFAELETRVRARLTKILRAESGPIEKDLGALEALEHQGSCTSCANLAAAVFRACGVPTRIVSGYAVWYGPHQTHYIVEIWAKDRGWVPFESTHIRSPWPASQQIQVAVLLPEDEDKGETRACAFAGVPYLSLTELARNDEDLIVAGAIPDHAGCDHEAVRTRELAGDDAAWPKVLERARASWKGWLEKSKKSGAPDDERRKLGDSSSLEALAKALEGTRSRVY